MRDWGGSATAEASYSQSVLGYMRLDQSQASIYIKNKNACDSPQISGFHLSAYNVVPKIDPGQTKF